MKNILVLSLLSVSIFTLDVRASSSPEPNLDMRVSSLPQPTIPDLQQFVKLATLLTSKEFSEGDHLVNGLNASRLVSSIENSELKTVANSCVHSAQIHCLRSELAKQQARIDALENKFVSHELKTAAAVVAPEVARRPIGRAPAMAFAAHAAACEDEVEVCAAADQKDNA